MFRQPKTPNTENSLPKRRKGPKSWAKTETTLFCALHSHFDQPLPCSSTSPSRHAWACLACRRINNLLRVASPSLLPYSGWLGAAGCALKMRWHVLWSSFWARFHKQFNSVTRVHSFVTNELAATGLVPQRLWVRRVCWQRRGTVSPCAQPADRL